MTENDISSEHEQNRQNGQNAVRNGHSAVQDEHDAVQPAQDRRIRKTRAALKRALAVLMKKKNIKDISVKEITELADVNRGTFYLHYKDVYDLLEQSEADFLNELRESIASISPEAMQKSPQILFENVYGLCKENSDMVNIYLGENGDIRFLNEMSAFLKEKCLTEWSFFLRKKEIEYFDAYFSFIVGGCCSLLQYWFSTGMKLSTAELAGLTVKCLDRHL